MEENTEEEYDDTFELGCLDMFITILMTSPFIESVNFKSKYFKFRAIATKFDIELPGQVPKRTTDKDDKKQFYQDQTEYVEARMMNQSQYIREMFGCGQYIEKYIFDLSILADYNISDNLEDSFTQEIIRTIQNLERNLQLIADNKHVDISEELSKVQACLERGVGMSMEELMPIKLQLRRKLGKRKKLEEKRSEIDPSRIITNDCWAISLVRLPDSSYNEHAFLVLEGQFGNTLMIWFADFVGNDALDLFSPGVRDGKVRIDYHQLKKEPGSSQKLLFRCGKKLMNIGKGDRILYETWEIPKPTGEMLVRNLKTQQDSPPKYNILGNTMLAGKPRKSK